MSDAFPIRAGQIKAARAILGWSQEDLALASQLSIATVRNIEKGQYPRNSTIGLVRSALEAAGIEFLDCDGVKKRVEEILIFQGPHACERFYNDLVTMGKNGVIAISQSQQMLIASLGSAQGAQRSDELDNLTNAKCLLSEIHSSDLIIPSFELRTIPKFHVGPSLYFVYADRYAVVVTDDGKSFRYVVFKSASLAHSYRKEFQVLWDMAFPLSVVIHQSRTLSKTA